MALMGMMSEHAQPVEAALPRHAAPPWHLSNPRNLVVHDSAEFRCSDDGTDTGSDVSATKGTQLVDLVSALRLFRTHRRSRRILTHKGTDERIRKEMGPLGAVCLLLAAGCCC